VAMTTCPDCKREVSDSAPKCPGCGKVLKSPLAAPLAAIGIGIAVILLFVVLVVTFGK
jgi:hypothetical protein